jgi:hypothetical protein
MTEVWVAPATLVPLVQHKSLPLQGSLLFGIILASLFSTLASLQRGCLGARPSLPRSSKGCRVVKFTRVMIVLLPSRRGHNRMVTGGFGVVHLASKFVVPFLLCGPTAYYA